MSSLALASMLEAVGPAFEAAQGLRIEATLLPTALLLPRIVAGERGDAAILTADAMETLIAAGVIDIRSRRALARSRVGMAVRAGAPRPAIGTEAALVEALLGARSIALSRAGASGLFIAGLLQRLGIAEAVAAKAVVIESGYTAALAADGRAELALQQVSELLMVKGVDLVGPLPPGLDGESVFSGGVFEGAQQPGAAAALLAMIAGAEAQLRKRGLAPV